MLATYPNACNFKVNNTYRESFSVKSKQNTRTISKFAMKINFVGLLLLFVIHI